LWYFVRVKKFLQKRGKSNYHGLEVERREPSPVSAVKVWGGKKAGEVWRPRIIETKNTGRKEEE